MCLIAEPSEFSHVCVCGCVFVCVRAMWHVHACLRAWHTVHSSFFLGAGCSTFFIDNDIGWLIFGAIAGALFPKLSTHPKKKGKNS